MKSETAADRIAVSHKVMKIAIGNNAKPMAAALRKYGKRATEQFVRAQGDAPTVTRANTLENFERWLVAFVEADNLAGLDTVMNEVELVIRLARAEKLMKRTGQLTAPITRAEIELSLTKVKSVVRTLESRLEMDATLKHAEKV